MSISPQVAFRCWLSAFALVVLAGGPSKAGPSTGITTAHAGGRAVDILGIASEDAGTVGALAEVMEAFPGGKDAATTAVDHLARTMMKGVNIPALHAATYAGLHVDIDSSIDRREGLRQYGTESDRADVAQFMWTRAKLIAPSDPELARDLARSAFVLQASDGKLWVAARGSQLFDNDQFAQVAKLEPDVRERVKALARESRDDVGRYAEVERKLSDEIWGYVEKDRPLTADGINQVFALAEKSMPLIEGDPVLQYRIAHRLWRLANLARSRKDADGLKDIVSGLDRLRTHGQQPVFDRLLEEAKVKEGPPPVILPKQKGL